MKNLGNYQPEYEPIIDVYAELWEQYHRLTAEYRQGKSYGYSVTTGDGGEKKSPLVGTLENLRKDILAYSDRLMLNPKARAEPPRPPARSKLAEVLAGD